MPHPGRRPELPHDPARQHLVEARRMLLRLHKMLIDSERADFEMDRRPLNNAEFLQALLEDEFFAWLRPFTALIVAIDEALATREPLAPGAAADFLRQTTALVAASDAGPGSLSRYDEVRRRDPGVQMAHGELLRHLAAAPAEGA